MTKTKINDTPLFKQVASVIGGYNAMAELGRAYRNFEPSYAIPKFNFNKPIYQAFHWDDTDPNLWVKVFMLKNPYKELGIKSPWELQKATLSHL